MSDIKIKYCIDNMASAPFDDEWDIEGGLSIAKGGLVLTKPIDDPEDDGFRGDYVFYNLERWVDSVPKICYGETCELHFVDSPEIFSFVAKGEFTFFKYFIEGSGKLIGKDRVLSVEEINKRYPNHEEGTPLKTDELISEIIEVSELFIESLDPKMEDKSDVIRFKQALDAAREAYESYVKRREQI